MSTGTGFSWIDASIDEAERDGLFDRLGIAGEARAALLNFGAHLPPSRKLHTDDRGVAFPFGCYVHDEAIEVHVFVTGDYVLTLHTEGIALKEALDIRAPSHRSEQYVVYAVLEGMVITEFERLYATENAIEDIQTAPTGMGSGRVRIPALRDLNSQLSSLRRRVGPQRGVFERITVEIQHVEGLDSDNESYFERIGEQLNRLVDAIDAAGDALSKLADLSLNETTYRLTAIATIFLPLTFITGFFGMNFGWMVRHIDTATAFVLLGLGAPLAGVLAILLVVTRSSPEA
jgi:magnesium transporter